MICKNCLKKFAAFLLRLQSPFADPDTIGMDIDLNEFPWLHCHCYNDEIYPETEHTIGGCPKSKHAYDEHRDYIGLSSIIDCPAEIYRRFFNPTPASVRQRLNSKKKRKMPLPARRWRVW